MDVPELIELIQTHLPDELTEEQIAEIRAKLTGAPELQGALIAELSTEHASPPTNFEEVITRIRNLAESRRRKHPLIRAAAIIVVIAAIVGVGLTIRSRLNEIPTRITDSSQPERRTTTRPSDTHVTTAPTTRPEVRTRSDRTIPGIR